MARKQDPRKTTRPTTSKAKPAKPAATKPARKRPPTTTDDTFDPDRDIAELASLLPGPMGELIQAMHRAAAQPEAADPLAAARAAFRQLGPPRLESSDPAMAGFHAAMAARFPAAAELQRRTREADQDAAVRRAGEAAAAARRPGDAVSDAELRFAEMDLLEMGMLSSAIPTLLHPSVPLERLDLRTCEMLFSMHDLTPPPIDEPTFLRLGDRLLAGLTDERTYCPLDGPFLDYLNVRHRRGATLAQLEAAYARLGEIFGPNHGNWRMFLVAVLIEHGQVDRARAEFGQCRLKACHRPDYRAIRMLLDGGRAKPDEVLIPLLGALVRTRMAATTGR